MNFLDVQPARENVLRVQFDLPVNWTGLLDPDDASRPDKWTVTADVTTTGMSGDVARSVGVAAVVPTPDDPTGYFVDVVLDRPMTPYPAAYVLSWTGIATTDLSSSSTGSATLTGAYRVLSPPQVNVTKPSRDFANPQSLKDAQDSNLPNPEDPLALGTFTVATDGDYAFDEGLASLRKRIIRRLCSRKGAFAHLPNYGAGIPDEAKRLGIAAVLSRLAANAQAQVASEPDVAQARVISLLDQNNPGLVFFRVVVQPRVGKPVQFDVPFKRAA